MNNPNYKLMTNFLKEKGLTHEQMTILSGARPTIAEVNEDHMGSTDIHELGGHKFTAYQPQILEHWYLMLRMQ